MEKRPKTIALVTNTSWNLVHFRSSLAQSLREKGYRVLAIAPPDAQAGRLKLDPFSRYYPWTMLRAHGRHPVAEWKAMRELRRLYKYLRPDLALHFTVKPNLYGAFAAAAAGIPSVCTITGLGYTFLHPQGGNRLVPLFYRQALRKASAAVFQNEEDRDLFLTRRLVSETKATLIPGSGVDTGFFHPQKVERNPGKFTFFLASRLLRDKGILEFLAAARRLAEEDARIRIWIAGEPDPENPAALSPEEWEPFLAHPAFHFWGFLEDIRPVMAQADVFVLPSHREGMPRAVLEALSMGKPVLTTLAPGCRDTVDHGQNGLLVPVKDAEALLAAMQEASGWDAAVLKQMGQKSREKALEKFDVQLINRQFLNLIQQLL